MSTPDQRARDKDRDAAIDVVEAAWADGQIVEADRDRRVEELLRAQTLAEIRMLTHDLQLPGASAHGTSTVAPHPYAPGSTAPGPYGYATLDQIKAARPAAGGRGCAVGLVVLVVAIAIFGVVVASLVSMVGGVDDALEFDTTVTASPLPGEQPAEGVNALSERGYRELLRDVEAASGSTEAFEAVLYPAYAVVYLPVDGSSQRQSLWYWNGEMDDLDSRGTSSWSRFDLATVDVRVVVRLVKRVRGMVEDPTSFYAILRSRTRRRVRRSGPTRATSTRSRRSCPPPVVAGSSTSRRRSRHLGSAQPTCRHIRTLPSAAAV